MRLRLLCASLILAALAGGALRAAAQHRQRRSFVVNRPASSLSNLPRQVFVPGFGFRPVVRERFPVFGLGFDAHHFHVLNRGRGFNGGFVGGGFFGKNFFGAGFGFFPVVPFVSSSSTVVVVPQAVPQFLPIQVPVPVTVQDDVRVGTDASVATSGLPPNWERLRVARPSYPTERTPLAQLTLIVLKDHTIFAVTDYWLEGARIFYVTSAGSQGSVAVRELDWEMSTQLNAERGVPFVVRSR